MNGVCSLRLGAAGNRREFTLTFCTPAGFDCNEMHRAAMGSKDSVVCVFSMVARDLSGPLGFAKGYGVPTLGFGSRGHVYVIVCVVYCFHV